MRFFIWLNIQQISLRELHFALEFFKTFVKLILSSSTSTVAAVELDECVSG